MSLCSTAIIPTSASPGDRQKKDLRLYDSASILHGLTTAVVERRVYRFLFCLIFFCFLSFLLCNARRFTAKLTHYYCLVAAVLEVGCCLHACDDQFVGVNEIYAGHFAAQLSLRERRGILCGL